MAVKVFRVKAEEGNLALGRRQTYLDIAKQALRQHKSKIGRKTFPREDKKMFCIACGTKGVRWPKHLPQLCSMSCGAYHLLGEYSASGEGFYCLGCGGYEAACSCGGFEEPERRKTFPREERS
jgi:hypothetical protein